MHKGTRIIQAFEEKTKQKVSYQRKILLLTFLDFLILSRTIPDGELKK